MQAFPETVLELDYWLSLYQLPWSELSKIANRYRREYFEQKLDYCSIINAKSGKCSEDCRFCAQSVHFKTGVEEYSYLDPEKILTMAQAVEAKGVNHFSLVTSGKSVSNSLLRQLIPVYKLLKKATNLQLCASHGLLNEAQAFALKEAGASRYHHNLETSRSFYSKICTTHHFDERVATVKAAKMAGMEVCCGGIIGLGENVAQRIELALEISQLQVDSIPLNFLMPVKGTPMENNPPLQITEILKILALFRIINPKTEIRIAGGRQLLSGYENEMLKAGISGLMVGNYLTTNGVDPDIDLNLKHSDQ